MRLSMKFTERLSAPRALVFSEVTDFENLQDKFPDIFVSIRIVERSKNVFVTEERFSVLGAVIRQRSRHTVRRSTTHAVEILTGDLEGSKVVERYSDGPSGGTVVKVEADFILGGLLSVLPQFMVRPIIEGNLRRIFDELETRLSGARS
jgi:carbon monoxide dehydrogenase subunit G